MAFDTGGRENKTKHHRQIQQLPCFRQTPPKSEANGKNRGMTRGLSVCSHTLKLFTQMQHLRKDAEKEVETGRWKPSLVLLFWVLRTRSQHWPRLALNSQSCCSFSSSALMFMGKDNAKSSAIKYSISYYIIFNNNTYIYIFPHYLSSSFPPPSSSPSRFLFLPKHAESKEEI